ncbi:MAG: SPFH domain-containing protein [Gemmatimonadaceae bacterium]|nr:SPFH domain-containing protein [Gemmatimonadaceae bacterium]
MTREFLRKAAPGLPMLFALLAGMAIGAYFIYAGISGRSFSTLAGGAVLILACLFLSAGLFTVEPNEAKVLQLFGTYKGTVRQQGLFFANPFFTKKRITLRARNFETTRLKVNDKHSNPVEIAAIVVWRVIDSAEALFEVENVETYVMTQSESALRALATKYPYDAHAEGEVSLSVNPDEIANELSIQLTERFAKAGVEVIESRVSHLAYAPEIAGVMLQRQQASAMIAARTKIVEGAVGMVDMALQMVEERGMATLDGERRAAMISNLLVVLCGERSAQPVLNTGTIYQ